jgi:outer membrane protein assembly factor BamD
MKTKLTIIFIAVVLLASCKPKLEEPDVLYAKAIKSTYKGNFNDASSYLNKIDENYPYTEYSKNAVILLAYVTYKKGDYSELLPIIEVFIKTNPRDANVPYMLYLKGLSYYDQIINYKKDKQILYEFLTVVNIMKDSYPSSIYTSDLVDRSNYVKQSLSSGELDVAIQYQKKDDCIAAITRYLEVLPFLEGQNLALAKNNASLCLQNLGIKDYNL